MKIEVNFGEDKNHIHNGQLDVAIKDDRLIIFETEENKIVMTYNQWNYYVRIEDKEENSE